MKKKQDRLVMVNDDLLPEYEIDYSKAKQNPYASRLSDNIRTVVLDPDVAAGFPNAESVNQALRKLLEDSRTPVS